MQRIQSRFTGPQFLAGEDAVRDGALGLYDFKPEIAEIAASPKLAAVRRLDLAEPNFRSHQDKYNPRFEPMAGEAFAVLLGSPHLAGLRELFIRDLALGALSTERIAAMPALEELSLERCGLGDEGVRRIVAMQNLRWIDLTDNGIGPRGAAMLGAWLAANPRRRVQLSGNPIELSGARAVVAATSPGGEVRLSRCGLSATEIETLAREQALANAALIDFSGSKVSDDGARALGAVRFHSPPELHLENCGISDAGARALIPVASGIDLRRNNLVDLRGLVGAPTAHLAWLGLTGNGGAKTSDESNEGGVVIWSGSRDLYEVEITETFGFRVDLQIR